MDREQGTMYLLYRKSDITKEPAGSACQERYLMVFILNMLNQLCRAADFYQWISITIFLSHPQQMLALSSQPIL